MPRKYNFQFDKGPIGVGALNQYYDFSWKFQFDPGEPFKNLNGIVVIRVRDSEAHWLAEGNIDSSSENAIRAITRLTYHVRQQLQKSLSIPIPELRQILTLTSREIEDLMNVDPARVQKDEWISLPELIPEKSSSNRQSEDHMTEKQWDVFISHATEDKVAVAKPLAETLSKRGIKVWYDTFTLTLGDSLRRKIDDGLARSSYGIVVLSHSFFSKEWPQKELDGLAAKEYNGKKVILPIWHNLTREEVAKYSPMLADRLAVLTSQGLESMVEEVLRVLRPDEPNNGVSERSNTEIYPQSSPINKDFPRPKIPIEIDTQEVDRFFTYIESTLDERFKTLEHAGVTVQKNANPGDNYSYQVRFKTNLIYHFSMRRDDGSNLRVSFLDGWTEPIHENAYTASGTIYATLDNPTPRIQIINLSLLETAIRSADLSYQELIERIWSKACNVIEQRRKQMR